MFGIDEANPEDMTDEELETALATVRQMRDYLRSLESEYIRERVDRREPKLPL